MLNVTLRSVRVPQQVIRSHQGMGCAQGTEDGPAVVAAETLPGEWSAGRILGYPDPSHTLSPWESLSKTNLASLGSEPAIHIREGTSKRLLISKDPRYEPAFARSLQRAACHGAGLVWHGNAEQSLAVVSIPGLCCSQHAWLLAATLDPVCSIMHALLVPASTKDTIIS